MPLAKKDRRQSTDSIAKDRRQTAQERRSAQRILLDLEVDYECEDTYLFAYIADMSALGIFIRTNNPEKPGTNLNLRFTLPGDEAPLSIEGEVIWVNPYRPGHLDNINPGMGVRFIDLDENIQKRLIKLIKTIAYLDENNSDSSK